MSATYMAAPKSNSTRLTKRSKRAMTAPRFALQPTSLQHTRWSRYRREPQYRPQSHGRAGGQVVGLHPCPTCSRRSHLEHLELRQQRHPAMGIHRHHPDQLQRLPRRDPRPMEHHPDHRHPQRHLRRQGGAVADRAMEQRPQLRCLVACRQLTTPGQAHEDDSAASLRPSARGSPPGKPIRCPARPQGVTWRRVSRIRIRHVGATRPLGRGAQPHDLLPRGLQLGGLRSHARPSRNRHRQRVQLRDPAYGS